MSLKELQLQRELHLTLTEAGFVLAQQSIRRVVNFFFVNRTKDIIKFYGLVCIILPPLCNLRFLEVANDIMLRIRGV